MAKFIFDFPVELEQQMLALGKAADEDTVGKMLAAGGEKVQTEMQQQCLEHKQSGRMIESIKQTKAKRNEKGFFVTVRPTGKESRKMKNGNVHTVRNAEKLAYLHYGTTKQPATGIITKAINRSQVPAVAAMQAVFNREVLKGES